MKISCWAQIVDKQEYTILEAWVRKNAVSFSFLDKQIYATGVGDQTVVKNFIDKFEGFKEHSIQLQRGGD